MPQLSTDTPEVAVLPTTKLDQILLPSPQVLSLWRGPASFCVTSSFPLLAPTPCWALRWVLMTDGQSGFIPQRVPRLKNNRQGNRLLQRKQVQRAVGPQRKVRGKGWASLGRGWKGNLEKAGRVIWNTAKRRKRKDRADRDQSQLCQTGSHSCSLRTFPYYLSHWGRQDVVLSFSLHKSPQPK